MTARSKPATPEATQADKSQLQHRRVTERSGWERSGWTPAQRREVGSRIRQQRLELKLRQTEVERLAKIPAHVLQQIEHGRLAVAPRYRADLASALNVEPSFLQPMPVIPSIDGKSFSPVSPPNVELLILLYALVEDTRYPEDIRALARTHAIALIEQRLLPSVL